jgi:hypothetical protein
MMDCNTDCMMGCNTVSIMDRNVAFGNDCTIDRMMNSTTDMTDCNTHTMMDRTTDFVMDCTIDGLQHTYHGPYHRLRDELYHRRTVTHIP